MEDSSFVYFMISYLVSKGILSTDEADEAIKELQKVLGGDLENAA